MTYFLRLVISACMGAALPTGVATAESSLADIEAAQGAKAAELAKVDAMLSAPDANDRMAAMELLIRSDNPIFVRKAKEAGLFSSDPFMRVAALRATLDSGGPFQLVLTLKGSDDKLTGTTTWLGQNGGTLDVDGGTGSFVFNTSPYDPESKCWKFLNSGNCALALTGETVTLPRWSRATGKLTLGSDGMLKGTFQTNRGGRANSPVPAEINIAE